MLNLEMTKKMKNPQLPSRTRPRVNALEGYKFRSKTRGKSLSEKKPLYKNKSGLDGNEYSLDELELQ